MTDAKRLNTVLAIIAILVLVFSFSAFAYTLIPKGDASLIVVNEVDYGWGTIFSDFESEDFVAMEDDYTGVPVSQIILDTDLENSESYTYRFIGLDGYQKDVTWDDVQNSYLVEDEHMIVFPHMTRSFWVRDLASIEVVI